MDEVDLVRAMRQDYDVRAEVWAESGRERLLGEARLAAPITNAPGPEQIGEAVATDLTRRQPERGNTRAKLVVLGACAAVALIALALGALRREHPVTVDSTPGGVVTGPSTGPTSAAPSDEPRLTPRRDELPPMPPTAELEARFRTVPVDHREAFGLDIPGGVGYAMRHAGERAFPVFAPDGSLAGIYVSALGMVDRATYEDPTIDLEDIARQRLGNAYDVVRSQSRNHS